MRNRWAIAALLCAALLPQAGALASGFVNWDDHWLILENPWLGRLDLETLIAAFDFRAPRNDFGREYLPIRDLSWLIEAALFGKSPAIFHLSNLLLHAAATLLCWRLLLRLGLDAAVAFAGALLFAVHPVHVEAVAWASSRKGLLAAVFMLGGMLCFITWREQGGRARAAGVVALYALALLSKYPSIVLPGLFLAWDYTLGPHAPGQGGRGLERREMAIYLPLGLLAFTCLAIALAVAVRYQDSVLTTQALMPTLGSRVATMLSVHLRYVALLVVPLGLRPIHAPPPELSLFAVLPALGLLLLIALAAAATIAWRRNARVATWLLLFHAATLAPVMGILPIRVLMAERYLYLPSLAACALLGWGLMRLPSLPLRRGAIAVVTVAFALLTAQQQRIWQDDLSFWTAAVAGAPGNPTALLGHSDALAEAGELAAATDQLAAAAKATPPGARRGPELLSAWEAEARQALANNDSAAARHALKQAIRGATAPPGR